MFIYSFRNAYTTAEVFIIAQDEDGGIFEVVISTPNQDPVKKEFRNLDSAEKYALKAVVLG